MFERSRRRAVGIGVALFAVAVLSGCGSATETSESTESTSTESTDATAGTETESSVASSADTTADSSTDTTADSSTEPMAVTSTVDRRTATGSAPLAVAVGTFQGCASDGIVECWGSNDRGQLGQGHTNEVDGTLSVQDFSGATVITSGDQHTCGLVGSTGEVFCWGFNDGGQLGVGDLVDRSSASRVTGLPPATLLAAGDFHTCAVGGPDRSLWCWGMNSSGQLGFSPNDEGVTAPRQVEGVNGVIAVDGGFQHTCAVVSDGSVNCFGDDLQGQSGGAIPGAIATVEGVADAVDVRVGMYQSCARIRTGEVRCWGSNLDGQFGSAPGVTAGPAGVEVSELGKVDAIAVGMKHVCALTAGKVSCLGAGVADDGSGIEIDFSMPQPMNDPNPAVAIAAGYNEICAIHADGSVACWNYEADSPVTVR